MAFIFCYYSIETISVTAFCQAILIMLRLIKSIFGMERRHQRSESEDANSKRKSFQDPRRTNSIDSKPKPDTAVKQCTSDKLNELD